MNYVFSSHGSISVANLPPDMTRRELAHIFRPFQGFMVRSLQAVSAVSDLTTAGSSAGLSNQLLVLLVSLLHTDCSCCAPSPIWKPAEERSHSSPGVLSSQLA